LLACQAHFALLNNISLFYPIFLYGNVSTQDAEFILIFNNPSNGVP